MPGIVVGLDESRTAHRALQWAMREAAIRQTALTVLTVIPAAASPWTGHPLTVPNAEAELQRARQAAEGEIERLAPDHGEPGRSSVRVEAIVGYPAQALIDASRDADLVVVGARGQGGFAALLLGSVSSQVAHHAASPVVIVPSGR